MSIPGFSAEAVFQPPGALARQAGDGGGGGPIIIDGNCVCIEWKDICLGFGGWCFPFVGCVPSVELCFQVCTRIRCTPR
jgi:hypothetical protein